MSLRRAVHSSRGVLPTVVRRCVWSKNRKRRPWPALSRSVIEKKLYTRVFNLRSLTRRTAESDETVWKDRAVRQLKYAVTVTHD